MSVETGSDGPIMLDLVEEALDEIAPLVGAGAERRWIDAMVERPDVGLGTLGCDLGAERIAVVSAIRQKNAFADRVPCRGADGR